MIRIISKEDVSKLIHIDEVISLLEKVFADYSKGMTIVPLRTKISVENHNGNILYMPAYLPQSDALGVKVVSVYPENAKHGLQTIFSVLMLNDAKTGEPVALMDAEYITALRTGGVSGLAAKYLSKEDSSVVSIFGAGVQSKSQLLAIKAVRDIKKVFVFARDKSRVKSFCSEMSEKLNIEVVLGYDQKNELAQSDIIIAATTSSTPVFDGDYVSPGTFITGVGSYTPTMQEIPQNLIIRSSIIVDAYSASMKEAGDIIIPINEGIIDERFIKAELGEVIIGKYKRQSEDEIIFFKSVGLAIQDMCVAPKIYERACSMNIGALVSI